jgi:hypothetical protein
MITILAPTLFFFTSASFLPTDLGADLEMWLDASDSSTITITGSGVSTWADKSSNANDATQSTDGNRPTITAAAQNGLDVLECVVSDPSSIVGTGKQWLQLPDFSALSAGTVIAVAKSNADPPSGAGGDGRTGAVIACSTSMATLGAHHPYTDGNVYDNFGSTARKSTGNPTESLASCYLLGIRSAPSDYEFYVNASSHFSTGTNTVGFSATLSFVGKSLDASMPQHYGFDGQIAEIVLLNVAATTLQRQKVEGYLAWKWGIESNLPGGHPYEFGPP